MKSLSVLLFFFLSLASCTAQQPVPYQNIGNDEFNKMRNQPGSVVLDVRTPEEYNKGHVPNASLINFYDENFSQQLDSLDKDKTYLVYCAKGGRSSKASELMVQKGFTKVYNFQSGFSQWNGTPEK